MRFLFEAIWELIVIVFVWPLMAFAQMLNDWQCCLAGWRAKLDEERREILNRRKLK